MPLSEEEQRILEQIEASLRASDPALAQHVSTGTMSAESRRRLRLALVGMVLSTVASILLLAVSYVLAFVAFLVAFGAAAYALPDLRDLGKARIVKARSDLRAGVKESLKDVTDRNGRDAGSSFN